MTSSIRLSINTAPAIAKIKTTQGRSAAATVRTLNRITSNCRTRSGTLIKQAGLKLTAPQIKKRVRLSLARQTYDEVRSAISNKSRPLVLAHFDTRPRPSPIATSANAFEKPAAGIGLNIIGKSYVYPHSFYARMPDGHIGVYVRAGRERLKIRELYGPAVSELLEYVAPQLTTIAQQQWTKIIQQELYGKSS